LGYLIDTNIAIHARDGTESVLNRLAALEGSVLISALSLAELQRGLHTHHKDAPLRRARLAILLGVIPVLPFDAPAALAYGAILAQCGWVRGRDYDRMIAGHAIATESILVSNNLEDFRDIAGLSVENWIA
jgi:tRNA(fMet)-specific endonuclease VapC